MTYKQVEDRMEGRVIATRWVMFWLLAAYLSLGIVCTALAWIVGGGL